MTAFGRASFISVALGLVMLWSGCSKKEPTALNWKLFSPAGGNFKVLLPSEPVRQDSKTNKQEVGFESVTYRIVTAMSNIAGMAVGYADQPRDANVETDPAKILDKIRDKSVLDLRGSLMSEKPIKLGNYSGRELRISVAAGFTVRERIYLANNRLYSLMVIAGASGIESREAETFFNSFQILK